MKTEHRTTGDDVATPARLIIEADGGSRGNPGPAAFGALVRDADTGRVLAEAGETIGVATNNVAEYRGLISGLRMAQGIDPEASVEARLDSKLVVEQMSGRWKIKNAAMRQLALEAQRILPPTQVRYTWVPRAENKEADRLVNEALDGSPTLEPSAAGLATAAAAESAASQPNRLVAGATDVAPPTTLILVRHGQTSMTRARAFSGGGTVGPALDDVGQEQARRAATLLAAVATEGETPPVVIASPMVRTRQTAEEIAAAVNAGGIETDAAWRECEFGDWEGLTLTEITERFPDDLQAWFGSTSFRVPGGESLDDLAERIGAARDRLLARYPGRTVIVVTHSMPVRTLVRLALDAPSSAIFRLLPATGSVTEIQHFEDGNVALTGFNRRP